MEKTSLLSFLEIAVEDLEASILLSNHTLFPQSIFYLQQSIEKTAKYLGLRNNTIEQKDLMKDISHKTSKIFKKEVLKHKKFSPFGSENDINNEFAKVSNMILKESLDNLIPFLIEEIDKANLKTETDYDILDINSLEKLINFMIKSGKFEKGELDNFISSLENPTTYKIIQEYFKSTMDQGFLAETAKYANSALILFLLSSLFEKVFPEIRYPSQIEMLKPSSIYNESNILVKNLNYFQENTKNCIQVLIDEKIQ